MDPDFVDRLRAFAAADVRFLVAAPTRLHITAVHAKHLGDIEGL